MAFLGERTTSVFAVWIWLAAPLALASCTSTHEYPGGWARLEVRHSAQACAMIAGVYKDYGEPGIAHFSERDERYWDHGSLIYNLLSKEKKHQLRSQGHVSRDVDHLIRAAPPPKVEIAQPAPDILEVMVWSGINDRLMLRRDVLSMDKGDFSCGPDGLRLRSHTELFVWGISNAYGSVSRTLNRSEDGSLVMKIEERLFGLHVFVPLGLSSDYWVRWTPIARSSL